MIDYVNKDLFMTDGTHKQIVIAYDGGVITNSQIHYEQFELTESLNSENQLKFGSCEAAMLKFRIVNPFDSLTGKELNVSIVLDKDEANPFILGTYYVYSDKPSADRKYRDIVAYDRLYEILNANVSDWYNGLFPDTSTGIPLKTFRNAFFAHFGLEQEEITLVNDTMAVFKTIDGNQITGKIVLNAICEINGCFGNIGRNGKFRYVYLPEKSAELYPANDLYPSDDLYPLGTNAIEFSRRRYKGSPTYEDYKVQKITQLQIRMEENDIGVVVGEGDNTYVIQDNFLVYGMSTEELTPIAENILNAIKVVEYRPCSVKAIGSPCLEVGDLIRINTKTINIDSYVLRRVLSGIQVLTDSYSATGEEKYALVENGIGAEIQRLKGKSNVLERTIEETKSTITDVEKNLQSQITQNAGEIQLKVSEKDVTGNYIVGKINLTSTTATIKAAHIKLEGLVTANSNFKVLEDGSIEAVNATLNGSLISYSSDATCYMGDGEIRLYPEIVADPDSYEGDDYSVLSHDRFILNGSAYINELKVGPIGHKPMLAELANDYYGMVDPNGHNGAWIRTTSNGIIPYQSGGASALGTATWRFNNIYGVNGNFSGSVTTGSISSSGNITSSGVVTGVTVQCGNSSTNGGLELYHATPFIDFHFGKSTADYTSRIIEYESGKIKFGCSALNFADRCIIPPEGTSGIRGNEDNTYACGHSSYRWTKVYAKSSSIDTSDEREKDLLSDFDLNEMSDFYMSLKPIAFKWKTGEDEKIHLGLGAQTTVQKMIDAGYNPEDFSLIQHDELEIVSDLGLTDRYGMEYNSAHILTMMQTQKNTRQIEEMKKHMEELENKLAAVT